jgi:hypothetical protein
MENLKKEFLDKLHEIQNEINRKADRLKSEARDDEAKIEKIKLNIVGIFEKMFLVSYKKAINLKDDDVKKIEVLKTSYMQHFDNIPKNWYDRLNKAKEHKDFETAFIEEAKIDTMKRIRTLFEKVLEG